jgi:hypothetical protein
MRTHLIAALSLSAVTPSHDAEACGSYVPEPRVFQLTAHFEQAGLDDRSIRRTFAVLGDVTPPATLTWRRLSRTTFDSTSIADSMPGTKPVTLTLVGASGTRVVSINKHVFLSHAWDRAKATRALDIGDANGFSIAIEGAHPNAAWSEIDAPTYQRSGSARAWVTALGVTPGLVYVSRVPGKPFEVVTVMPKDGSQVTFVKHGDRNLGRFDGSPIGAFTNNGATQLVLVDGTKVSTAYL